MMLESLVEYGWTVVHGMASICMHFRYPILFHLLIDMED